MKFCKFHDGTSPKLLDSNIDLCYNDQNKVPPHSTTGLIRCDCAIANDGWTLVRGLASKYSQDAAYNCCFDTNGLNKCNPHDRITGL